jgi:hypothetical protein
MRGAGKKKRAKFRLSFENSNTNHPGQFAPQRAAPLIRKWSYSILQAYRIDYTQIRLTVKRIEMKLFVSDSKNTS